MTPKPDEVMHDAARAVERAKAGSEPRKPVRIQRLRAKGWRVPEGAVYVGRGSRWGNPFRIGEKVCMATANKWRVCEDADQAVRCFAAAIGLDDLMIGIVQRELRGKDLMCWCPLVDENGAPVPCHADILLELANGD